MYVLLEENKDLKEEIGQLKALNWDDRAKTIGEENQRLKRRCGELIVQVTDLESKVRTLKREDAVVPKTTGSMFNTMSGSFKIP